VCQPPRSLGAYLHPPPSPCCCTPPLPTPQSFYIRAVPSRFNPGTLNADDATALAVKAGFAFTLGLRLFYLFVPLVSAFLGALLCPWWVHLLVHFVPLVGAFLGAFCAPW